MAGCALQKEDEGKFANLQHPPTAGQPPVNRQSTGRQHPPEATACAAAARCSSLAGEAPAASAACAAAAPPSWPMRGDATAAPCPASTSTGRPAASRGRTQSERVWMAVPSWLADVTVSRAAVKCVCT